MLITSVDFTTLDHTRGWHTRRMLRATTDDQPTDGWVRIGDIVSLSKEATDPARSASSEIVYIGLEHVSSKTGRLVGNYRCEPTSIKSRSRIVRNGDILYGRLRPYLNKVLLVDLNDPEILCSGEFLVLKPNASKAHPVFLRELLASSLVCEQTSALISGSALPRMDTQEFLDILVHLPPINIQTEAVRQLKKNDAELQELQRRMQTLDEEREEIIEGALSAVG